MLWSSEQDDEGRRGVHNSPVMIEIEEDIERRFPGENALPILIVAWADGTSLTLKMSAHPVVAKIANCKPAAYTKRVSTILL
jgi:hypothetical protein